MLLKGWAKDISLPVCNSSFQSLHSIASLHEDISEVLPYLNTELGAHQIIKDPPSVTFKIHGRLITLHPRKIAINALESSEQAESIMQWLKKVINDVWDRRHDIQPSYKKAASPTLLGILKCLPRTNCKKCGQITCFVFATLIIDGGRTPDDCRGLDPSQRVKLEGYLCHFNMSHDR